MAAPAGRRTQRAPRYDNEDTSLTTDKELMGWYSYGLAAEVFAVCGVGSFLPVTLEQLARERGVLWSDRTIPCVQKASSGNSINSDTSAASFLARAAGQKANGQCVIRVFGTEITTASFAMYTFSVAVFVQALVLVSFSAVADHGNWRKRLLLSFGFVGATASMLFLVVVPKVYLLGSFLVIVGVTCLGSSFVVLNSFLPLLATNHPPAQNVTSGNKQDPPHISMETLSSGHTNSESADHDDHGVLTSFESNSASKTGSVELQLSTRISSKGTGIGYLAAVFVQCLSILLLFSLQKAFPDSSSQTLPLRLVLFMVGVWWFAFSIPAAFWLRNRPGPPLSIPVPRHGITTILWLRYVSFAWSEVWKAVKTAAKLRQVVIFLIAWFLLSDAVATISGTAVLFARTELHMGTVEIAVLSITATTSGIAGAFTWPIISRKLGLKNNHTIVACIVLMEIIPVYGLIGYLPFIQAWGVGGLQRAWEIYPLGVVHGFVMGGLSSYCRSFFGLLIPPDREAAFYALYAITDKGSSAVGPAIVGAIVDATGTIRPAFAFLAVLIALPVPLMWVVDAELGRADAIKMAGLSKVAGRGTTDADVHVDDRTQESQGLLDDHEWHSRPMNPSHTTYIINENPEAHVAQSVRMYSETSDFGRG